MHVRPALWQEGIEDGFQIAVGLTGPLQPVDGGPHALELDDHCHCRSSYIYHTPTYDACLTVFGLVGRGRGRFPRPPARQALNVSRSTARRRRR